MILRVFPHRTSYTPTDVAAFIGGPGDDSTLLAPHDPPPAGKVEAVHVSVCFTWDLSRGWRLVRAWQQHYAAGVPVLLGGPAVRSPCGDFVPGRYVREGITYTSRGCDGGCAWCQVAAIEGRHRVIEDFAPGHIIADNDFLGCPWPHRERVYRMLGRQPFRVEFRGGLCADKLTPQDVERIGRLRIAKSGLWFACDTAFALEALEWAAHLLKPLGLGREKLRCYVLAGFDPVNSPESIDGRCREIWQLGFIPFLQMYRGPDETTRRRWPDKWAVVCKRWSRPALSRRAMRPEAVGTLSMQALRHGD